MRARRRSFAWALDIAVVAGALLLGWGLAPATEPRPGAGAAPASAEVLAAIDALVVAEPAADGPYDRAEFPHWIEISPDCDTRCAVLDRQRSAGGWWSAYDGYVAGSPAELEIDHVVPLAEAWQSGASTWTRQRRQAFANDLASAELLAVSSWSNQDKGAADPALWRPPDPSWWCSYAEAWASVKARWALTADTDEIRALRDMAQRC